MFSLFLYLLLSLTTLLLQLLTLPRLKSQLLQLPRSMPRRLRKLRLTRWLQQLLLLTLLLLSNYGIALKKAELRLCFFIAANR